VATPQDRIGPINDLFDAPAPRRRTGRAPKRAGGPDSLSDLFDSPRPSKALAPSPRARPEASAVDARLDSFVSDLIAEAARRTGYRYKLGSGVRTPGEQAEKVAQGLSKTYHSRHLTGRGRDVLAFDGRGAYIRDGRHPAYAALGEVYRERAAQAPARVRWGGDFEGFYDPGHFEIDEEGAAGGFDAPPKAFALADLFDPLDSVSDLFDAPDPERQKLEEEFGPIEAVGAKAGATPSPLPRHGPPAPDIYTPEGRAERDRRKELEADPEARATLRVRLPEGERDWSALSSRDVAHASVRQYAAAKGIEPEFVERWLSERGGDLHVYDLATKRRLEPGEAMGRADIFDADAREFVLSAEMPHLRKLEEDYQASLGTLSRASVRLGQALDDYTPGEHLVGVGEQLAGGAGRALDVATRPLQAGSSGFFSAYNTGDFPRGVSDAYHTLRTGERSEEAKNPLAERLRSSEALSSVNPNLRGLLGGAAEMILDPSNIVPLGLVFKGGKLLSVARGARGVEAATALGDDAGRVAREVTEAVESGRINPAEVEDFEAVLKADDGRVLLFRSSDNSVIDLSTGEALDMPSHAGVTSFGGRSVEEIAEKHPETVRQLPAMIERQRALARSFEEQAASRSYPPGLRAESAEQAAHAHAGADKMQGVLDALRARRADAPVPVPERPETVAAQLDALKAGRRAAVLVTPGADVPPVPEGMRAVSTGRGVLVFDPRRVSGDSLRARAAAGDDLGDLLGHVEPGSQGEAGVVVARDPRSGVELQSSRVSTPEGREAQTAALGEQFPGAEVRAGGEGLAREVIAARSAGDALDSVTDLFDGAAAPASARKPSDALPPAPAASAPAGGPVASTGRAAAGVADFLKSNLASGDASAALRQALIPLLSSPRDAGPALLRGLGAVKSAKHADIKAALESHPLAALAEDSGLEVSALTGARSEFFPSSAASRLPWVAPSERVMESQLDLVRMNVFDREARGLLERGLTFETHPRAFRDLARVINTFSGRGSLGPRLKRIEPVLQRVLFSPRLLKSRLDVLNPVFYARLDPAARRFALRKAARTAFTLGGLMSLASLAGYEVGFDPRRRDFGKLKAGGASYDLTGGIGHKAKFLIRFGQSVAGTASKLARGEEVSFADSPLGVTARFLRSQLGPAASLAPDLATGETYDGKPLTARGAVADRLAPLFAQDLYEGWLEEGGFSFGEAVDEVSAGRGLKLLEQTGFTGALKALPAGAGVGVRFSGESKEALLRKEREARNDARPGSWSSSSKPSPRDLSGSLPAGVRDELRRARVTVEPSGSEEFDRRLSDLLAEEMPARVEAARSFRTGRERRAYLSGVVSALRERVTNETGIKPQTPAQGRAKDSERITIHGPAGDELRRLGVTLKPVSDYMSVKGAGGDSISFRGESLGQSPEDLKLLREGLSRELQAALSDEVASEGFRRFKTDEEKRKRLNAVISGVSRRVMNRFRRETRTDDLGERRRLEEYQRRLEGRGPKRGPHFKP
jgi:peptidoglycan LD-endopeptidase CwlK